MGCLHRGGLLVGLRITLWSSGGLMAGCVCRRSWDLKLLTWCCSGRVAWATTLHAQHGPLRAHSVDASLRLLGALKVGLLPAGLHQ